MTDPVVVDASITIKWLIEEEFSDRAEALFERSLQTGVLLLAPPHLPTEVANALYRRSLQAEHAISESEAEEALARFLRFPIQLVSSGDLYLQTLAFARSTRIHSIYDVLYVVLAQPSSAELWTADRRLLSATAQVAPWVRWIGDYPTG